MTPDEKEEARRRVMERMRERREFLERQDRLHPPVVPGETRDAPHCDDRKCAALLGEQ